ncbi:MAG: AraC family transcriptional regulator [Bacteroidota bacterium]
MVDRATKYIDEHYDEIQTVQDVAAALKCPYHSLRKAFAQEIGMPMQNYLHRVRVRAAKVLMKKSTLKLYAIARQVGYSSDNSLRRHWKKFYGRCPGRRS